MKAKNIKLIHKKFFEYERMAAREKLSESEKLLSGLVHEKNIDKPNHDTEHMGYFWNKKHFDKI